MNYPDQNAPTNDSVSGSAEATLRLIAKLPAPAGLEDRVHAGLLSSLSVHPHATQRTARVLSWPATARAGSSWMRSAAAAAIVFVVAGGGWGIYSRVQQPQSAKVIVLPHGSAPGEFTNAGAMRTPKTLNGPVLAHPALAQPAQAKIPAKAAAPAAPTPLHSVPHGITSKATVQPVEPLAK